MRPMAYEQRRPHYWSGRTHEWGGPTAAFRRDGSVYSFVTSMLEQPGVTAMFARHIDAGQIVKGLVVATGAPESDVIEWLEERAADSQYRFSHALRCWGLARFRKNYLPYYHAVRDTMKHGMEHHDVAGITRCMKLKPSVEYVASGRRLGYSWSIIQFGAENGIAMEYLDEVIVQPERNEDNW